MVNRKLGTFSPDVENALNVLGLSEGVELVPVDKMYSWLTRQLTGRMLCLNGVNGANSEKSRLYAYHAQILKSVLDSVHRRELTHAIATLPDSTERFKLILQEVLAK